MDGGMFFFVLSREGGRGRERERERERKKRQKTERGLVFAKHTSESSTAHSTRDRVYLHRCNVAWANEIGSAGSDFTTSGPAAVITSLIACFPQGSSHYSGAVPPNSVSLRAGGEKNIERDARSLVSVAS